MNKGWHYKPTSEILINKIIVIEVTRPFSTNNLSQYTKFKVF